MKKTELRRLYQNKRNTLSAHEVSSYSAKIFENFIDHFTLQSGDCVHLFRSMKKRNEVDTLPFCTYFFAHNVKVFVPIMVGNALRNAEINPDTRFKDNAWGVPEPVENFLWEQHHIQFKCILTPMLYCDAKGNRIGYGKGFYDRLFFSLDASVVKIGLSFFGPAEKISDVASEDVALDYLVTPDAVLSFGRSSSIFTR